MIIKNYSHFFPEDLEKYQLELRKFGLNCLEKAINAVKPEILMKEAITIQGNKLIIQDDRFDLDSGVTFEFGNHPGGGGVTLLLPFGAAGLLGLGIDVLVAVDLADDLDLGDLTIGFGRLHQFVLVTDLQFLALLEALDRQVGLRDWLPAGIGRN